MIFTGTALTFLEPCTKITELVATLFLTNMKPEYPARWLTRITAEGEVLILYESCLKEILSLGYKMWTNEAGL